VNRVVVVGASAGGVEALGQVAATLPKDFPAPVAMVLHIPAGTSVLPTILSRKGGPLATHAVDGEELEPGRIYVAPPDRHLLLHAGRARTVRGPTENGHRPAVDPLFRSAALSFGPGAFGVVLTGTGDDGAAGAASIDARGGCVVVQDPADAFYSSMPEAALLAAPEALTCPLAAIGATLDRLVREERAPSDGEPADEFRLEESFAMFDMDAITNGSPPGDPSGFACPACGGALWEVDDEAVLRFRCRVGHAFSAESLLNAEDEQLDTALWSALRALEERGDLSRRIARRLRDRGVDRRAETYEGRSKEAERNARLIREMLLTRNGGADAA
jgi:two-component system, chemotaxis family, protein-glutamate methylesterase/glutaminase